MLCVAAPNRAFQNEKLSHSAPSRYRRDEALLRDENRLLLAVLKQKLEALQCAAAAAAREGDMAPHRGQIGV